MELENSPLYTEVMDVFDKCDRNTQVFYEATLLLNTQGDTYDPMEVVSYMTQRDYADNFADETSLTLKIPLGKYAYKVYPNRTTLKVSLRRISLNEQGGKDLEAPIQTALYSAVLIEEGAAVSELQGNEAKSEQALDLLGLMDVKFQLFDQCLERVRVVQVGGIYRKTTVTDLLKGLLTQVTKAIKVNNQQAVDTLEMTPANNANTREQMVIPQGVNVVDVPGFIQQKYGIYDADIGSYVQDKCWYLYPLFNTGRFKDVKKTLTIYILPPRKFPEIERSYRSSSDSVAILSVTQTDFRGDNDINYIVSGNGVRYTDAGIIMEDFSKTEGNKTTAKRNTNNNEYISQTQGNELKYAPVSEARITSNPFTEFSKLARRKGGMLKVQWINSDPGLVIPGMCTRIVYMVGETLQQAYGVLLGGTHICVKVGGVGVEKHTTNSMLYFFSNLDVSGTS